jgi:hypothetical protein
MVKNRRFTIINHLGLSTTDQQYFSLRTNEPPATNQQHFSLKTNQHQHQPPAKRTS